MLKKIINKIKWKYDRLKYYLIPFVKGYIKSDGQPIKCKKCKCKDLIECNHDIGGWNIPEGVLTEFDVRCSKCGNLCGHWAYGNWEVL